jgi:hypothetical protein
MIDADTGNIHLPNGFVITPALTLKEFRQSWFGRNATANRPPSTPGECWFSEDAGDAVTGSFRVGLSFQNETLRRAWLECETVMTGEEDEAWIERKQTHDALLLKDFGEPDTFTDTYGMDAPGLGKAPNHLRPWGKAVSEFDYGGGDAYISITYYNGKAL